MSGDGASVVGVPTDADELLLDSSGLQLENESLDADRAESELATELELGDVVDGASFCGRLVSGTEGAARVPVGSVVVVGGGVVDVDVDVDVVEVEVVVVCCA